MERQAGLTWADREALKEMKEALTALQAQVSQLASSQSPPVSPTVEEILPRVMQGCMLELQKEVAKAIAAIQGEWDLHRKEWQEALANDMETMALDRKALQDATEGMQRAPGAFQAEARALMNEALMDEVPRMAEKAAKRALELDLQVLREDLPLQMREVVKELLREEMESHAYTRQPNPEQPATAPRAEAATRAARPACPPTPHCFQSPVQTTPSSVGSQAKTLLVASPPPPSYRVEEPQGSDLLSDSESIPSPKGSCIGDPAPSLHQGYGAGDTPLFFSTPKGPRVPSPERHGTSGAALHASPAPVTPEAIPHERGSGIPFRQPAGPIGARVDTPRFPTPCLSPAAPVTINPILRPRIHQG